MSTGEQAYDGQEVLRHLKKLPGWSYEGGALRRTYHTDGWRGSLLVANAIAFLCEAADHHADLTVTWPSVGVALSTHSAGGITARDVELAGLIEAHIGWLPPSGSSLKGPPRPFVRRD